MSKFGFNPQKVFIFSKYSILPASLLAILMVYFLSLSSIKDEADQIMHGSMVTISIISILVAIYFKALSVVMSISITLISYILINNTKALYGEDFVFSASYNVWTILLFPNLLIAYFAFYKKRKYHHWSLSYVFLFAQTLIAEKIQTQSINPDSSYFYHHIGMLNYPTLNIAIICMLVLFVSYIRHGRILCSATMYSMFAVLMGVYYSDNTFAFSLFSIGAVLIQCTAMVIYTQYIRFKDEDLDMANYKAFFYEAENKYPLKYSIALMYLDDYARLQKRFGKTKMLLLKKMFLERIKDINESVLVYNYKEDALILAFKNANAAESYEKAEEIRRSLVKSIFVFNENNHLQLTVSQCVCEKKRSDADTQTVLIRAEENLLKACKFTRNITIKA